MSRRGWVLFAAMCVIWGLPYLLIRVAVRDLSPVCLVCVRTSVGAALLAPVAARRGAWALIRRHWAPLGLYALVEVTAPWLLLSYAERRLTSSFTALLIATVPLIAVGIERSARSAVPIPPRRVGGLAVGFVGVVLLVGADAGRASAVAIGAALAAAVGYAVGPVVLTRRLQDFPGPLVVAVSLGLAAVVTAPFAVPVLPSHVSSETLWAVAGLSVICTAVAFLVFLPLVAEVGPSRVTVITYVNPGVALALGVLVLGEHITVGMLVGFPVVIAGTVLGAAPPRRPAVAIAVATADG